MNSIGKKPTFLPTLHQELLVKACLFEGRDSLAAWEAWRGGTNLDHIDSGSVRLLPLLAQKLQSLGVDDPAFEKYRGTQRRTWARNQLLFRSAGRVFSALRAAQISAMALKGVVLATSYYGSVSLRPMGDFDLLVRPADGPQALGLLEALGWRVCAGQLRPHGPVEFATRAATALDDPANPEVQLDLHWRLLWARYSDEAELALWGRAVRFEIGGAECLAPCAADMLVHVCAHGARWNDMPPLRWIVDAAFLVRSDAVDWSHLCAQTKRLGLARPLVETLHYLRTTMRVPVPEMVIQDLAQAHANSIERLLHDAQLQPSSEWSLLTALRIHQHIAWHELVRFQGLTGYWRYGMALRRGRSMSELALWVRERLSRGMK